jgi:steroid delta-isomerase-like uncharacterized protein
MDAQAMLERSRQGIDAWNRHDADGVVANLSDDAVWVDVAMPEPVRGKAAIKAVTQEYLDAIPDLHVEMTSHYAEGDTLVEEWHATGHQRGELMGVPPSGNEVDFTGCAVTTFDAEGHEREIHQYWGVLTLMQQIGALPTEVGAR